MKTRRILALHGVAQSGPVFQRRCQNIVDHLTPLGFSFHFLTAPHGIEGTAYTVARQADYVDGDLERSWWTTNDGTECHPSIQPFLETVRDAIKQHGPFEAVMGFSQGGCAAASLTALLEPGRRSSSMARKYLGDEVLAIQPPLDFLVLFSANPYRFPLSPQNDVNVLPLFYPSDFKQYPYGNLGIGKLENSSPTSGTQTATSVYAERYPLSVSTSPDNKLSTPTLAFYGQKEWDMDVFSRNRQQWLISRLQHVQVQAHPWKHTVPRTDEYAGIVVGFVKRIDGVGESGRPMKASL